MWFIYPIVLGSEDTEHGDGMKTLTLATALTLSAALLSAQDNDMVFVSVNPCVIFDTRPAFSTAGAFGAEETRSYYIAGTIADFGAQGGSAGGCGVPGWSGGAPVAQAVFMNYVAIEPQGAGQIKSWDFDETVHEQGSLIY